MEHRTFSKFPLTLMFSVILFSFCVILPGRTHASDTLVPLGQKVNIHERTTAFTGTSSVYRFYNTQTGTHFFTISESEKNYIIDTYPQFTFEGVAWYAYPPKGSSTDTAQWGVTNLVGCAAALTFQITIDGVTKKSVTYGTSSEPTFEGWADTTTGLKNYTFSVSGSCMSSTWTGSGTTSEAFEKGKKCLFITDHDGTNLTIGIAYDYTGSLSPSINPADGSQFEFLELDRFELPPEVGVMRLY